MRKFFKMVILILMVVLSLQQVTFAAEKVQKPPKPTVGVEASDPQYGTSADIQVVFPQSVSGLLANWSCSISNPSNRNLGIAGSSTANTIVDQMTLTLYLQQWDGSKWVDIKSWTFNNSVTTYLSQGVNYSCQAGYYYRTREFHAAKKGAQTETQNSTSSYIYVG